MAHHADEITFELLDLSEITLLLLKSPVSLLSQGQMIAQENNIGDRDLCEWCEHWNPKVMRIKDPGRETRK